MFTYAALLVVVLVNLEKVKFVQSSKHKCNVESNVTLMCNYIPKTFPAGILNIKLNLDITSDIKVHQTSFMFGGYEQIKRLDIKCHQGKRYTLKLQNNCFKKLEKLQVLRLHVVSRLELFPETFVGLDALDTLDMSASYRLNMYSLIKALNGSDKLPRLTTLNLSNCSFYTGPIEINDNFVQVLQSKKISNIDLSGLQLAQFNMTSIFQRLSYLNMINASYAFFEDIFANDVKQDDFKRLISLDISHATLPKKAVAFPAGRIVLSNSRSNLSDYDLYEKVILLFTPQIINCSGFIPHTTYLSIEKSSLNININPKMFTKEFIFRQNNVERLDITLICEKFTFSSFEHIDIAENRLEFVHPDFLSCIPNLRKIDVSKNKLDKMAQENIHLFERLFSRLRYLKEIDLSSNHLIVVPQKIFESNENLELIDLSNNKLNQVHFHLSGLNFLRVLNLTGNNIHNLDVDSTNNLDSILRGRIDDAPRPSVLLHSNPLLCSNCNSKPFLTWLLSTSLVNVSSQKLVCSDENGELKQIDQNTLQTVEKICERKKIIIITSISTPAIIFILVVVLSVYKVHKLHARKLKHRANVMDMLRDGEGFYEFAVFLAFSNEDEDIVNTYILNSLNENLQLMTGLERELVCTGDRHFRPGFYVHNEVFRQLEKSSVMVAVVSNNFCQSDFCRNELDQAYMKKKPIVLMFIEHIDECTMTPTIKELYKNNVRILWTLENGEYKMKTTWGNVCTSILDLIN